MTESVFKNVKRIYSICRFLSFLACSMSFMPLSAQQASYLVTKSSSSVQSLCWSQDDSLYAVGADNEVFVMKADGNSAECSVPVPAASFLGFAKESVSDSLLLLALSEQGTLSAWNVNGAVPLPAVSVINAEDESNYVSCAFSPNSNFIAAGMDDGTVRVFFKLRYMQKFLARDSHEQKGRIRSIAFSKNSRFMASASDDGTIVLHEAASGEVCACISAYSSIARTPVAFSSDGMLASVVSGSRDIFFYDIGGRCRGSITSNGIVQAVEFIADGDTLAVQTSDGYISFYTSESGRRFAYIAPCNNSSLKSFAFTSDGSALLEGYEDGSVYRIDVAKALNYEMEKIVETPVQEPVKTEVIEEPFTDIEESLVAPAVADVDTSDGTDFEYDACYNSLILYAGGIMLQNPFSAAASFGAELKINAMAPPFYFGVGLDVQVGAAFDSSEFPYNYYQDGKTISPPHTGAFTLYAPVGMNFNVGKKEKPLKMFAELHAGAREILLWQTSKKGVIRTDPYLTWMVGAYCGVNFHGFQVQIGFDYDPIQKFTPGVFVGYSIMLKKQR